SFFTTLRGLLFNALLPAHGSCSLLRFFISLCCLLCSRWIRNECEKCLQLEIPAYCHFQNRTNPGRAFRLVRRRIQHRRHPLGRLRARHRIWSRMRQPLATLQRRGSASDFSSPNSNRIHAQSNERTVARPHGNPFTLVLASHRKRRLATLLGYCCNRAFA